MMAVPRDNAPEEPTDNNREPGAARDRRAPMTYRITFDEDFLRAELAHRETVEEMREFLRAVARNSARCPVVLIQVRESKPLFHVERDGLVEYLQQIAQAPQHRVALVADTADLQASHEYLELIARQRGVCVRSFRSDLDALQWFKDRRAQLERRLGGERRGGRGPLPETERRGSAARRQAERRLRAVA
jgi:hypothetical protein